MSNHDEPLFDDGDSPGPPGNQEPTLSSRIRRLVKNQPYAVLCVQGEGQPYGALVAFAFSEDLRHAVFATPIATRKYRLLSECDRVALVVDSRPSQAEDLMEIEAVTATGRSVLLDRAEDIDLWAGLLVAKHPYLRSFAKSESCGLFVIDIVRFFHVARFQEVNQWIPTRHS
jgi:uncharacterized protein YhbP (UPF0306 family)